MQEGKIGEISKVEVAWNEYSPYRWATSDAELQACKKSDLDWPAFLMGKADRPFDPRIYRSFRLFRDFSSGIVDQWMTHGIDIVHFLTGHDYPLSAVAHGGIYHWRDWVIEAYNSGKSFADFTVQQLAGDLLPNASERELIATHNATWRMHHDVVARMQTFRIKIALYAQRTAV